MAELRKSITAYGKRLALVCDGRCDKAWGINGRPKTMLGKHEDDFVWKPDANLGAAPGPGQTVVLSEGGHMKPSAVPLTSAERMNKWCLRECERADSFEEGEAVVVRDLSNPKPNIPRGGDRG